MSDRQPLPDRQTLSGSQSLYIRVFAIIAMLSAIGLYLYINRDTLLIQGGVTGFVSKIKPIAYDYNSQAGVYSSGGYFYFFTKDGISYRSQTGEVLWNDTFDIAHPEAFGAGGYVAVAELRGFTVRVYGAEGLLYNKSFDIPILNFSVNETGYCCVKLQNGNNYQTEIYNETGEWVQTRHHTTANVFPITAALSRNGQQLALSLLDINGVDMQTHLLFAHVPRVTSVSMADGEWGGYVKNGQIIASLKFNGNNNLLAASDTELSHYLLSDNGTSSEGATVVFENEVRALKYMGDNGVVLALGRGLTGKNAGENTVQFYNADLSLVGEFAAPKAVTYLNADKNGAIVGTGYTYYGFNTRGVQQWQYTAAKELKSLVYLGSTDMLLETGYTETTVLKREKIKETTDETIG